MYVQYLQCVCVLLQSLEEYSLSEDLIRESGKLRYLEKKLSHCQEQVRHTHSHTLTHTHTHTH